jgi:hypothetical protein
VPKIRGEKLCLNPRSASQFSDLVTDPLAGISFPQWELISVKVRLMADSHDSRYQTGQDPCPQLRSDA